MGSALEYLPYVLLSAIGLLALLRWPFWGLVIMVMLIPIEVLTTFVGGRTLVWVLGVGVLGAWMLRELLLAREVRIAKRPTLLALLWLGWALLSALWAEDQLRAASSAFTLAQAMVFFALLQAMITDDRALRVVVKGYIAAAVLTAVLAVGMAVTGGARRVVLAEGTNPIGLARALAVGVLMVPYLVRITPRKGFRLLTILGGAIMTLAILYTGARGVWVSLAGALGATWLLVGRRLVRARTLALAAGILVVGILVLNQAGVVDDYTIRRIVTLPDLEATRGGAGRAYIWAVGWEMVKHNPLLGVGEDHFPVRYREYMELMDDPQLHAFDGRDDWRAHNLYLAIQAELGIVGLLVFIMFFWAILRPLLRYAGDERAVMCLLFVVFFAISAFPGVPRVSKPFWLALGLAAAVPQIICRERGGPNGTEAGRIRVGVR